MHTHERDACGARTHLCDAATHLARAYDANNLGQVAIEHARHVVACAALLATQQSLSTRASGTRCQLGRAGVYVASDAPAGVVRLQRAVVYFGWGVCWWQQALG
jgi:hypothetical protein